MRVLHVISDQNIGGAGVLLTTLLRNFNPTRVQSTVALPKGSALKPRVEALGVPTFELTHPCDRFSLPSIKELKKIMLREQTEIVHANAAFCARIAGRQTHALVLHTRHCCFPPARCWSFHTVRMLGGAWNRALSDRVIATAEAAAENLRVYGVKPEQIDIIPNGSEAVREIEEAERMDAYKAWNFRPHDFTVGISARLVACKGHDTFLHAAKLLIEAAPHIPFVFLIAGEGEQRIFLEAMAKELQISNRVRFLGFVSDMALFYRMLRVNVNCSSGTETSCLALSEGMSAGVPMVVSDYGGNRAMIGNGEAGLLCEVGNAEAFANSILQIACNPKLEAAMRCAAKERYLKYYTAAAMTEAVTEVYEKMMYHQSATGLLE